MDGFLFSRHGSGRGCARLPSVSVDSGVCALPAQTSVQERGGASSKNPKRGLSRGRYSGFIRGRQKPVSGGVASERWFGRARRLLVRAWRGNF
jgi:hypothetical protein